MKAITYRNYGSPDVLALEEIDRPTPQDDEVLVRVHSAAVSSADSTFRKGDPYFSRLATGLVRPKAHVLGTELAGKVEAVGRGVQRFEVGDEIYGATGTAFGAHAEYLCLPQDGALARKPQSLSYAEAAAACEGALTALPFIRDEAKLARGQKILINGASGSVGTAAVQLAKHYGAEVTAVGSTRNLELMTSLGADSVVDYAKEDFRQRGETYDVIFDAVGKSSFGACKHLLEPGGVYLGTVPSLALIFSVVWTSMFGARRAKIAFTGLRSPADKAKDLKFLKELVEAGKYKPVVDARYALGEAARAHAHVDAGHKRGSVVLELCGVG